MSKFATILALGFFLQTLCWCGEGIKGDLRMDSDVSPAVVTLRDYYRHVKMPPKGIDKVLRVGEKLVYRVTRNRVPIGEATFSVKRKTSVQGREACYFSMESRSNKAAGVIYRVNNSFKSYVDCETGQSLLFVRDTRQGTYKVQRSKDRMEFDYQKSLVNYTKIEEGGARNVVAKPIPGSVQDPLSVFYYLRGFPLVAGKTREVLVAAPELTRILVVNALRVEELSLPGIGRFDTNLLELNNGGAEKGSYTPGIFVSTGPIQIWAETHTNIPLKAIFFLPVLGKVTVVLQNTENTWLSRHAKYSEINKKPVE